MQKFSLLVSVALLLVLTAGCEGSSSKSQKGPAAKPSAAALPAIGQTAPDFTLTGLDGRPVTLSALRGKVVVVSFWATWCPPCRQEMPSMELLHQELADEGLVILAVNVEKQGRQTVAKFFQTLDVTFPVVIDEEESVQNLYGVSKFPESFVVGKDGVITEKIIGAIDWMDPRAVAYFRGLLKE